MTFFTTKSVYELNRKYKINLSGIWQECHFNISDIASVYNYITTPVSKNGKDMKWKNDAYRPIDIEKTISALKQHL